MSNEHEQEKPVAAEEGEEVITAARSTTRVRQQMRLRLAKLKFNSGGLGPQGILGTSEIIGLAAAAVLLSAVAATYFYVLAPARTRLMSLHSERDRLQAQLRTSTEGIKRNADAQAGAAEILESLTRFEVGQLASGNEGRTAVIEQLNDLVRRNSARISAAATFVSLEALAPIGAAGTGGAPKSAAGVKGQTVYPGVAITLTVEGQYANLRRLVQDIEASRRFMVVNSAELEEVTSAASQTAPTAPTVAGPPAAAGPGAAVTDGGTAEQQQLRSSLVSMRLGIVAYFRRDAPAVSIDTALATSEVR